MLTKNHRGSIDVDPEWTRLQEDVIASPRPGKKGGLTQKSGMLRAYGCNLLNYSDYGTVESTLSLYNWNLHTNLHTRKDTKFGYCSVFWTDCRFIYLEMRDGGESSSPSSSRPTWHCPLVTSCGRKFHISIHTQTTEARESSYIRLDPWTQTAGNPRDLLL